ncbi:GntR family transcriptional regulator [Acidothermaceae bacterium B102]|nr:GntR family transcriptional regulator [Acidothermaceae bacterium B102]
MLTFVTRPDAAWDGEPGLPAADAICAAVRQRIVNGHYPGGQRLTEEQVAADFKASRTSVREALRMLNAEGFLVIRPYFGTHVATMTRQQASDLLELQGGLEAMAAGLAAHRRSPADVAELREIIADGRKVSEGLSGSSSSAALHGRFHAVLARAAGNESLALVMTQVRYKVDWVYASAVRRPQGDSWEEHGRIVDAIEEADSELAAQAAHAHVQHAVEAHTGD